MRRWRDCHACDGAALFLDYVVAAFAATSSDEPQETMLWRLLHETNPGGATRHVERILKRCGEIVDAAAEALAPLQSLGLPSALPAGRYAGHIWMIVDAAQRLLQQIVGMDLPPSFGGPPVSPALNTSLVQMYRVQLKTAQSKQLFLETLRSPELRLHLLDGLLCTGDQRRGSLWQRVFSWAHCPSQLRAPSSSRRVSDSSTSLEPRAREQVNRLLAFYAAAHSALQQQPERIGALSVKDLKSALHSVNVDHSHCLEKAELVEKLKGAQPTPPSGFVAELERQQLHLGAMLC